MLYHGIAGDTIVLRSAFPAPLGVRSSQDTAVHMQKGTVTETNAATTMWVDFNAESVSLVFDSTNGSAVDEPTPCLIELVYQKDISGWRVEEEFNGMLWQTQ